MAIKDLHVLPKVRDSLSYLYVEHCRIDQDDKAIALHDADGKTLGTVREFDHVTCWTRDINDACRDQNVGGKRLSGLVDG